MSRGIDNDTRTANNGNLSVDFEKRRLSLQSVREGFVVSIHTRNKRTPRVFHRAVQGCAKTPILLFQDSNVPVFARAPCKDLRRAVG
jgi:hypothetical protein